MSTSNFLSYDGYPPDRFKLNAISHDDDYVYNILNDVSTAEVVDPEALGSYYVDTPHGYFLQKTHIPTGTHTTIPIHNFHNRPHLTTFLLRESVAYHGDSIKVAMEVSEFFFTDEQIYLTMYHRAKAKVC